MSSDRKVGFTGTRRGMNARQVAEFFRRVKHFDPCEFHHGCCVGADEQAVLMVRALVSGGVLHCRIIAHPPIQVTDYSHLSAELSDEVRPELNFLDRNRKIIDETAFVIGVPMSKEIVRSGTWATLRYARKEKRCGYVILPDRTEGL